MGELSPWHLLIVAAVFMLLFGANKLPQMARSVGQSMRIFKAETKALSGEKEPEQLPHQAQPRQAPAAQAPPAPAQWQDKPPAS
jgi:sec-independent protein translocase protein TatA